MGAPRPRDHDHRHHRKSYPSETRGELSPQVNRHPAGQVRVPRRTATGRGRSLNRHRLRGALHVYPYLAPHSKEVRRHAVSGWRVAMPKVLCHVQQFVRGPYVVVGGSEPAGLRQFPELVSPVATWPWPETLPGPTWLASNLRRRERSGPHIRARPAGTAT